MKLSRFKTTVIIFSLAVAGLFVLYYFFFSELRNKNENISSLANEITFQTKKNQYMISMQKMIDNENSDISRINGSIIEKDGDVKFIEGLESIARQNNLDISIDSLVLDDTALASSTGITVLKIRAKTTGSWSGNYTFLAQIESLPFKIKVDRYEISETDQSQASEKKGPWESSLDIRVLKYR